MAFLVNDRWRRRLAIVSAVLVLTAGAAAGAMAMDLRGAPAGPHDRRELVVLVHGMGRSRLSMWLLGHRLERDGYRVLNWGYSSRDSVPALGAALADDAARAAGDAPRVHFVGHSLGNIVVRWTLAHERPARAGRVVMLAPPNQGAAEADRLARYVAWVVPQITELRTVPGSTVRALGPAPAGVDVGVIAGAEDGKVAVGETHLAGERGHVVVPAAHTFVMDRADVHRLTITFLRSGRFGESPASEKNQRRPRSFAAAAVLLVPRRIFWITDADNVACVSETPSRDRGAGE